MKNIFRKLKRLFCKTNVMGSVEVQKLFPRESIGECEKCGNDAIWQTGYLGSRKLCNRCCDKELGLD
jgi:hypothetical protein